MIYHFIVGDHAANAFLQAIPNDENNTTIILKDILHIGPLLKEEGTSFSEMRANFWNAISPENLNLPQLEDLEQLLEVSKQMYADDTIQAWIWIAPIPADVCAYYWLLFYLSKHTTRCRVVNIAGLPFLNDSGKLFFPKSIAELNSKEIVKATKLARQISNSEIEVDTYEWKMICNQNAAIRVLEGGKKISHHTADYYDSALLNQINQNWTKASKVISNAVGKDNKIPTGDLFLSWRLKEMHQQGIINIQGDIQKSTKDYEVALLGDTANTTT
jgi:hypothetical protein